MEEDKMYRVAVETVNGKNTVHECDDFQVNDHTVNIATTKGQLVVYPLVNIISLVASDIEE